MPNRYYSTINGKLSAPRPPKEHGAGSPPPFSESTHGWKTDVGPGSPNRNKTGASKVKQSQKTTL